MKLSPRTGALEFEQHSLHAGYYRVLQVAEDGTRRRIERGTDLGDLLLRYVPNKTG